MVSFGIVSEGITDQIVIENILAGYFDNPDISVNELQPLRDETDRNRAANFGGWQLVFEYCKSTNFKQAFSFCNYIIIQIDTDVSDEKHYDIPKIDKGKELSPKDLIFKVIEKFKILIGDDFFIRNRDKIIFAISVHSIECWLLPIYYKDKKSAKILNCLDTLNQVLRKKEKFTINSDDKGKNDYYDSISRYYLKHKNLMSLYRKNPSLEIFIQEIESKNITINPNDT